MVAADGSHLLAARDHTRGKAIMYAAYRARRAARDGDVQRRVRVGVAGVEQRQTAVEHHPLQPQVQGAATAGEAGCNRT